MTPEDILKLEAGLELDTLIAEKVMEEPKPTPITANDLRAQERVTEWYSTHYVWSPGGWWKAEVGTDHYLVNGNYISERGNMFVEWIPAKEPSTDIADAWLVVEKLREMPGVIGLGLRNFDKSECGKWNFWVNGGKDRMVADVYAETALLAICRASLMAVTK